MSDALQHHEPSPPETASSAAETATPELPELPEPPAGAPFRAPYLRYLMASFGQTLILTLRRKRVVLASMVSLCPVVIPLALAFLSTGRYADDGYDIFVRMVEQLYLKGMTPLLALFFGCVLIGEDVESQTIPYVLTRPMPRSAWAAGKLGAYLVVAGAILLVSIELTYLACVAVGGIEITPDTLKLVSQYNGISLLALLGYGSFCLLLGAMFKRPVIFGVVALFGWEKLANLVPGVVDFLTIQKYVMSLLPPVAIERHKEVFETALMEYQKEELIISSTRAGITLGLLVLFFLAATTYVVRRREYSSARALGS